VKLVRLGPGEVFHRYLTPKWAFIPLSGAGAAMDGGRFNRPGVEALYLPRAPQTALDEYRQGSSITPPATLAAYLVTLDNVVDVGMPLSMRLRIVCFQRLGPDSIVRLTRIRETGLER
jgi:RES domain-containing protein